MSPPSFYRAPPNLPVARASFPKPTAIPKAPIVNPYEKFTQPQFDTWIGDITGALRDALGYRAEALSKPKAKAKTQWHIPEARDSDAPDAPSEEADAEPDDSFAEVRARRVTAGNAKGKGRDPREGPGLGQGDRGAPIEIDLASEGEEEEEGDGEEYEWDEDDEEVGTSDEEEEEEENALRNGESSAHAHARYKKYAERREDDGEEEDEGDSPDVIEVISDDEVDHEWRANGLAPQDGQDSGEEYSDQEDANPTSLLVGSQKVVHANEYSDDGEETGSESEDEAARDSSPPQATHLNFDPDWPRYALDGVRPIFAEEADNELDEDVGSSPPRQQRGEPEVIILDSDEEDEDAEDAEEGAVQQDEELFGSEEAETEEDRARPQFSIPRDEQDEHDEDVLPGSSPILSSPIEPEHSFLPDNHNHEVFDVDEFEEEDVDIDDANNDPKPFDWDHPPAFARGAVASGPGHLATAVEDDVPESDGYPPAEVFGTSDLLPMFQSQPQTQSEAEILQFDDDLAAPFSGDFTYGYLVTEAGENGLARDNLENFDVYTVSRSSSVEPHHFTVEESFTDYEPEERGMSIDVVTVDGALDREALDIPESIAGSVEGDVDKQAAELNDNGFPRAPEAQDSVPLFEEVDTPEVPIDPSLAEEVEGEVRSVPQIAVEQNGDDGSPLHSIPMPVLADPTVHDPFAQPPSTPPRLPMVLTLPDSPFLISPVGTPSGQPMPVSLPVPASLLKAMHMRQESSLFTPGSENPSTAATPPAQPGTESGATPNTPTVEVDDTEDTTDNQAIPDASTQLTVVNEEDAEESLEPAKDETMVDISSDNVDDGMEQKDPAIVMLEESQESDVDISAAELPQATPIGEVSASEENGTTEEVTAEAVLPRDTETSVAPEVGEVVLPSDSEQVVNPTVPHEEDQETNTSSGVPSGSSPMKLTLAPSTTRILAADPYPYSLSTPGELPDPMEQEETTVSPSTADKDSEEKTEGDDATSAATSQDNDPTDVDEMELELQYPSEADVKAVDENEDVDGQVEGTSSVSAAEDVFEGEESETDADGDEDPDYEDTTSASSVVGDEVETEQPAADENTDKELPEAASVACEDGTMERVAGESIDVDQEPVAGAALKEETAPVMEEKPPVENVDVFEPIQEADEKIVEDVAAAAGVGPPEEPAEIGPVKDSSVAETKADVVEVSSPVDTAAPSEPPSQSAQESIQAPEVEPVAVRNTAERPVEAESSPTDSSLKRKRGHSPKETPSTSSNLGKVAESRLSRRYTPKRNGKGKAKEEDVDDDVSSTSSANSAARMLDPGSTASSRASSVVSARSANLSTMADSSPSLLPRVNSIIKAARPPPKLPPAQKHPPAPPAPPPPPPMMHAHSHHRAVHHHHPPPLTRQPTRPPPLQRTPSRASIKEESPTPSTSSAQMPAPPRRATPAANSPVTRSNCRYHRISLPEDDTDPGGRRVCFLVPGCSLGDKGLMDEENIKDEGFASGDDSDRMLKDLDALHFNSYLIGTLRQLVGVDLLREQEVYYLPREGEEPKLRKPRKREREPSKLRISSGGSFASEGSVRSPGVRSPASSRPPNSAAGSSSTASVSATARRRKRSESPRAWGESQAGDGETTDDESPNAKRIRAAEAEGVAAAAAGSPLRTRRSRRIDREAAEYKPEPEALEGADESSEEGDSKGRKKRKANGTGRGVKRGRQSEAVSAQEGGEDRKTKKVKTESI
ncbi:hypothetical protein DFH07DRAFT_967935 [Mycena maculata]|uniref:Uncharacterized protein n=1 Tax=Mycena maculata TaxID=230809 RepID=A0AAD7MWD5_9AGAR|nr:hypothetical protein DFH07DRAFT_967935 [Mycena maculata]